MSKFEEFDFFPLEGQPYFDNDRLWISPLNFLPENLEGIPEKIQIHDCTLRDGEQTPRVSFTKNERVRIAQQLNELGVDRIELGMPIISEDLRDAIKEIVKLGFKSKAVAFARANPEDVKLSLECGVQDIIIEHTVNPYMIRYAYGLEEDGVKKRIFDNVSAAKKAGLWTGFMGWDFSRVPLDYSRKLYQTAADAGADSLTLVDTFAVATPQAIGYAFRKMREWFPGIQLEFHVHNDFGMGMATAMAAVQNGAVVIHTAMNSLGERTGNLATEEVATSFGILTGNRTNVDLSKLEDTSRVISDITGIYPNVNKTVFGKNCFGIESGVVSHYTEALRQVGFKPIAYPYLPHVVGRKEEEYFIGYLSGKQTIDFYLKRNGYEDTTPEQREKVLDAVKQECFVRKALLSEEDFVALVKRVLK